MHDITIVLRGRSRLGSVAEALLYYRTFSSSSLTAYISNKKNDFLEFLSVLL